jgi:hypothetical protein
MRKTTPRAMSPRTATPPMVPPTIAPIGVGDPLLVVGSGVEREDEELEVDEVNVVAEELESDVEVDWLLPEVEGESLELPLKTVVMNTRPSVSPS